MKIWLLIILLVLGIAGFIASYGYAYQKISGVLIEQPSQSNTASAFLLNK